MQVAQLGLEPDSIEVFILVGGRGTRLASVVNSVPKPMAPVAGRPFLEYQIEYLRRQGFRKIRLLTGYKADVIQKHFGNGQNFGVEISYSHETRALGTGGAVLAALRQAFTPRFLLVNGDTFYSMDFQHFLREIQGHFVIAVREEPNCSRYGTVQFYPQTGIVEKFVEKRDVPQAGWINAGVYWIDSKALFEAKKPEIFSLERDLFPALATQGKILAVPTDGEFLDIGIPETFRKAQSLLGQWMNWRQSS